MSDKAKKAVNLVDDYDEIENEASEDGNKYEENADEKDDKDEDKKE